MHRLRSLLIPLVIASFLTACGERAATQPVSNSGAAKAALDALRQPATRLELGLLRIERKLTLNNVEGHYTTEAKFKCASCNPALEIVINAQGVQLPADQLGLCRQEMQAIQGLLGRGDILGPLQELFRPAESDDGEAELARQKQVEAIAGRTKIVIEFWWPRDNLASPLKYLACTNTLNGSDSDSAIRFIDLSKQIDENLKGIAKSSGPKP